MFRREAPQRCLIFLSLKKKKKKVELLLLVIASSEKVGAVRLFIWSHLEIRPRYYL